jgi:hypothetical protein
VNY